MKNALRNLLVEKYGDLDKIEPFEKSKIFKEVYETLSQILERDFDYVLEIKVKK